MKQFLKKTPQKRRIIIVLCVIGGVLFFGRGLLSPHPSLEDVPEEVDFNDIEEEDIVWTCSMHPQVRKPEPGTCPLCEMDLIPVEADELDLEENQIAVSEEAKALADIQVTPVKRKSVEKEVPFFGEVTYDETLVKHISADVEGRIEDLIIAYTGSHVRKGDPLFEVYSPSLISAQEELLQAQKRGVDLSEGDLSATAESALEAARQRLRWWGVTEDQIEKIEETREIIERLTLKSPIEGTVVEKKKSEGDYIDQGEVVYTVADLTQVWVTLEAYESDLPWIRYGQEMQFTADQALPGEHHTGIISFVDPIVQRDRRTARVRANISNPDRTLKPGMFVRGQVKSTLNADGKAAFPGHLEGAWISPLYPEVIREEPGECPKSGVPLEPAEALGYISDDSPKNIEPLLIPVQAPLITGKRAIVYVKLADKDQPVYEGREIELGPRAGEYYVVLSGLEEGEQVVHRGNFKLDSELQIDGRISMMSPAEEEEMPRETVWEVEEEFQHQLHDIVEGYTGIVQKLARDDKEEAQSYARDLLDKIQTVNDEMLDSTQQTAWKERSEEKKEAVEGIYKGEDIEEARRFLEEATMALEIIIEEFGLPEEVTLFRIHCPMAFDDEGADWFSDEEEVLNPYFGEAMLRCGEIEETLP